MSSDKIEEHTVAATLADPQYKAGRKLINDGRLEEAVNFFSGLLETRVAVLSGNEMCPALAPLYYEYGNSLLYNAEESGAVFGDAITEVEKKKAMAIVDAQLHGAIAQSEENGGGGASDGGAAAGGAGDGDGDAAAGDAPTPDQEAEDDLEIAWENLEMARRIYSELEMTEEVRVAIGKVHLRLGDLNMVNGMYNEAADEFEKCLQHRLAMPCPVSRGVADGHVRRAQALFYASTLEGADKDAMVALSVEQYRLAAGIFKAMISLLGAPPPAPAAATPTPTPAPCASPGKDNNGEDSAESSSETSKGKGKGKGKGRGEESGEEAPAAAAAAAAADADAAPAPLVSGSAEELQDALDAILETIDTMVSGKDMEALAEYKSGAVSTTVGFGDASSSSSLGGGGGGGSGGGGGAGAASESNGAGEVTTIGFGASSGAAEGTGFPGFGNSAGTAGGGGFGGASTAFSSSGVGGGAAGAPAANVMVVKRKGRPTPKVAPSKVATATANGGGAGCGGGQEAEAAGGDTAKKAKSNS